MGVRSCEQRVLEDLQPVGPQLEALRVRIRTVSMEDGVWAWGESTLGVPGIGVDRQPNIHIFKWSTPPSQEHTYSTCAHQDHDGFTHLTLSPSEHP